MKKTQHSYLKFIRLIVLLFLLLPLSLIAQNKFSSDPGKFIEDVNSMFKISKIAATNEVGSNFNTSWPSFSGAHQKKIIALMQAMQKSKKYRLSPHYTDYFSIFIASKNKNLSDSQIDSLIYMLEKSANKLSGNQYSAILNTTRLFLETDLIYRSSYNSLAYKGGSFSFNYKEQAEEVVYEEPLISESTDDSKGADINKAKEDFFSEWDNSEQVEDEWGTISDEPAVEENIMDVGYTPPPQPVVEGPVISFQNGEFYINSHFDTARFTVNQASVMLNNNVFVGKGGKFDWSTAGIAPEDLSCELKEFNFNIRGTKIICEGAILRYPSKTDSEVEGIFEYDSKNHKNPADNKFPRFMSFNNNIGVKDLGENIRYTGGFSMGGNKIYSSSVNEGTGTIEILHDNKVKIRSVSNRFELGDSIIKADISNVVLFQGSEDSICHPGTVVKFNKSTQTLKLFKHRGFHHAPFVDTYHKIEIVADALIWNLNESKINFSILNSKDQIAALFESNEYFNGDKYASMNGLYRFHPLQMIYGYSEKIHSKEFYLEDVAKANNFPSATVKGSMIELMKQNFIDFEPQTGLIKLKPKTDHYVLSRRNKKDYDNITFVSIEPSGNNATYDLSNNELTVRGVDKIYISDSLSVYFKPDNKELKILKNRDFIFNGEISTLNFQFKGKDFLFNYDSFLVHLPNIEVIKVSVQQPGDDKKAGSKKALGNELTYSSGILYINKPNNKSGRRKYIQYPIFSSDKGALVTFNKPNIANGAYDTSMKFKIPPFELDSLGSDDRKTIGFEGEFDSGGIFPPFKEKLVVMADLSLGFSHEAPKEGFPLYDGKGKFYNKIKLDNHGLRGDGEIRYLNAVLKSNDFLFLKDSVLTVGTSFVNKEGPYALLPADVKFPDMVVENYQMKWLPKSDKMFISDTKDPIQFYKNSATLQGTANLTTRGMFGEGILLTRGSESESRKFHFEESRFSGRDATFKIQSDNPQKPAMLCKGVHLDFDLVKGVAYFSPEVAGVASNEFPYAMYKSSLDHGIWDLKKKTVLMEMPDGGDINKSYFYSTRLDQDSLVFNATEAIYDITKLTLNIKGIPFIKVADAKIYPFENKVFIEENAVIQKLENAKIVVDTTNEYHHLYNASIDIKSRFKFEGDAIYRYVNLGLDTLAIKFTEFKFSGEDQKKKTKAYTVATGLVTEEDNLRIGPKIFYKGKVVMNAPKQFLAFEGFVKLDLQGALKNSQWFKYSNIGESSEVVINLENAVDDKGNPLSTGLYLENATNEMYSSFISEKKSEEDVDILFAKGLLNYNGERNEFSVANAIKLKDNSKKGNLISYNDSKSIIKFEGLFRFLKPNKNIVLDAAGKGEGNLKDNQYSFNTLLSFGFKMHPSINASIGKSLKQILQFQQDSSMAEIKNQRENSLPYKIMETAGPSSVDKYKAEKTILLGGLSKISNIYGQNIVFSDVNMKWSNEHKSFYSVGKVFISNIGKEDIGHETKAFIEIQKTDGDDIINIFIDPAEDAWMFYTYEQNRLGIVTSNEYINKEIMDRSKGDKIDRSKFFFVQAQPSEKNKFVADFKEKYQGVKSTYVEEEQDHISETQEQVSPTESKSEIKKDSRLASREEEVEEEYEIDENPMKPGDKKKAKKYKNNTDFDMLKYSEEEEVTRKKQSSAEERRQSEIDQKKLKQLLGN